jgi:hypothetical protein
MPTYLATSSSEHNKLFGLIELNDWHQSDHMYNSLMMGSQSLPASNPIVNGPVQLQIDKELEAE